MHRPNILKHNSHRSLLCLLFLGRYISLSSGYCENPDDCGDFMICLNNECRCDESDSGEAFSDYDDDGGPNFLQNYKTACRRSATIGDQCDKRSTICTNYSTCTSEGVCKCPPGLEERKAPRECTRAYNSPCNETQPYCNPDKFLVCRRNDDDPKGQGVCGCLNEAEMVFDPSKNSCVGRIGQQCELQESWMEIQLDCVENAHCSTADSQPIVDDVFKQFGVCKCNPGFVKLSKSERCEPIHGQQCLQTPDPGCADGFNLECVQNNCKCKPGSIFHHKYQECRLIHGTGCKEAEDKCVQNAACRLSYDPEIDIMCECSPGYLPTSKGLCHVGPFHDEVNVNCSIANPCHAESGLRCVDNICQCEESLVFDTATKSCIGVHGSPCSVKGPNCSSHAFCNNQSTCECESSFRITEEGYCEATFGVTCDLEDDDVKHICPVAKGLSCQAVNQTGPGNHGKGKCSCIEENTIFDKEAGRCLLRLGEKCKPPSRRCVTNAFCGTDQKCQCYSGYTSTPEGNCMLDYLQPCNTTETFAKDCNSFMGLHCENTTCVCSEESIFNQTLSRCVNVSQVVETSQISLADPEEMTTPRIENATFRHLLPNDNEGSTPTGLNPAGGSFSGLVIFSIMVMFAVLAFALVLNSKIQRRYHCLTS